MPRLPVVAVPIASSALMLLCCGNGGTPARDGGPDAAGRADADGRGAADADRVDADAEEPRDGAVDGDSSDGADAGAEVDADGDAEAADGGGGGLVDEDGDGLDDSYEDEIVAAYLPFLSVHPDDWCPRSVALYRLRPHPDDASLLHLVVVRLFEVDCGVGGHAGDDEVFGMTIDPSLPPPDGIVALRAISHQDTLCEDVSECGRCGGLEACAVAVRRGEPTPVVFYSSGKHGGYVSESACDFACFLTNYCALAADSSEPPMANAGEPERPLITDLTAAGLVTAEAGWTEAGLFGFDPWSGEAFGGAGVVSDDLVDAAFVTPACRP